MFKEKDESLHIQSRDLSKDVRMKLEHNNSAAVFMVLSKKVGVLKTADKEHKTQSDLKEIVSVAVGVINYDYDNAGKFSSSLLAPVQECIQNNSPLIRYYAIECAVNLTLILKENIFCVVGDLIQMIINSLRDVNVKVRSAALVLNETLQDLVIEFISSDKLNLKDITVKFSQYFENISATPYRNLIIEWLELIDGFPTFQLNDIFAEIFKGFATLLDGDSEESIEWFYRKIQNFIERFVRAEVEAKNHFDNCMEIQKLLIQKYLTPGKAFTNMGKLYMLTILNDIQKAIEKHIKKIKETRPAGGRDAGRSGLVGVNDGTSQACVGGPAEDGNMDPKSKMELNMRSPRHSQTFIGENYERKTNETIDGRQTNQQDISEFGYDVDNPSIQKARVTNEHELKRNVFDRNYRRLRKILPDNLSQLFKLLMNLAVDECQQIKDTHGPMFSQYQTMMKEIELDIVLEIIDGFVKENNILESGIEDQAENKGNRKTEVTLECLYELLKTVTGHVISEKEDKLSKKKLESSPCDPTDSVIADVDLDFVTKPSQRTTLFMKKSNYNLEGLAPNYTPDSIIPISNSAFNPIEELLTSLKGDESPPSPTSHALQNSKPIIPRRLGQSLDMSKAKELSLHPNPQNHRHKPKRAESMHEMDLGPKEYAFKELTDDDLKGWKGLKDLLIDITKWLIPGLWSSSEGVCKTVTDLLNE
jgi:hypothetical protein